MADVNKITIVVCAENKAAEIFSCSAGLGESGDDAVLGNVVLYFEPLRTSCSGLVRAQRMFCDYAFDAFLFGRIKERFAVFPNVFGIFHVFVMGENLLQEFLSLDERQSGQVAALME